MPLNPTLTNHGANVAADAVCALANNGFMSIYDGAQPSTADTPVTSQNRLARLTFGSPAFAPSANGVAVANAIAPDSSAALSGVATWFRVFAADGVTALFDGTVGVSGCNLNLNSVNISAGAAVAVSGFSYTQSES